MTPEVGLFALILALAAACAQAGAGLWGGHRGDEALQALARRAALVQLGLVAAAFLALAYANVFSDFSVAVVFENSHTAKPLIYKLSGVWGNHEGSMLLWALVLAGYGGLAALLHEPQDRPFFARALGVLGLIAAAFLAFIVFTSNPFARLSPAPAEGRDLNPLLQDPGLALHPPFLYLGYVGFAVAFAFAAAALIEGRKDARWAAITRPWALSAWSLLTIGIALGAWWAYYELGWGGFWAWDPVENASLMPWLAGGALVHSLRAVETRRVFAAWAHLLAILAFTLSLVGTFLVRSGVLTSVHAFAVDPARGVFILLILGLAAGGALALFAARGRFGEPAAYALASRETAILINNLVLMTICGTVFLGTFYPLIVDALTGKRMSVGAPYFNIVITPFVVLLLLGLAWSAFVPWRRGDMTASLRKAAPAGVVGVIAALAAGLALGPSGALAGAAAGAGAAVLAATAAELWGWIAPLAKDGRTLGERLARPPRLVWAKSLAHAGAGLAVLGAVGAGAGRQEVIRFMEPGEAIAVGGRSLVLSEVVRADGPNYRAERATFAVRAGARGAGTLTAERRFYPVRGMVTTEAGIRVSPLGDLYVTVGERVEGEGWPVHASLFPLTAWMWVGAGLIAAGGALSVSATRARRTAAGPSGLRETKAAESPA